MRDLASIAEDVFPELALATPESMTVLGALRASPRVETAHVAGSWPIVPRTAARLLLDRTQGLAGLVADTAGAPAFLATRPRQGL